MTKKHKVFVSYYHEDDEKYRNKFEELFGDIYVSKSVDEGDIDPNSKTETIRQKIRDEYLIDSTVTVVLVGNNTWKRKHVDWEISSSIRHTEKNPRSGLLGILLPTYNYSSTGNYYANTIPPRLWDNIKCEYAKIYRWSDDEEFVEDIIHKAFQRKDKDNPDNSRPLFRKNRSGDKWQE